MASEEDIKKSLFTIGSSIHAIRELTGLLETANDPSGKKEQSACILIIAMAGDIVGYANALSFDQHPQESKICALCKEMWSVADSFKDADISKVRWKLSEAKNRISDLCDYIKSILMSSKYVPDGVKTDPAFIRLLE